MHRIGKMAGGAAARLMALYIAIMLILGQTVPAVYAEDITVSLPQAAYGTGGAEIQVSGIRVSGIEVPVPGRPFDVTAVVSSAEGVQWEIPVMWIDETGSLAEEIAEDRPYFPVLVFSLPDGHSVSDTVLSSGNCQIVLDGSLDDLFGEGVLTVWLENTEITLIFPGSVRFQNINVPAAVRTDTESSLLSDAFSGVLDDFYDVLLKLYVLLQYYDLSENDFSEDYTDLEDYADLTEYVRVHSEQDAKDTDSKKQADSGRPAEQESDQPSPENSGTNSVPEPQEGENKENEGKKEDGKKEDPAPAEPADPLKRLVDIHCAQTAVGKLGIDQLKTLVDLIINRLQPQAVNLLEKSFSAFQKAAADNELGKEIGLYIYYKTGDEKEKNGEVIPEHVKAPSNVMAYVRFQQGKYEDGTIHFRYFIGVDSSEFCRTDENGKVVLNLTDEHTAANLENTIVHEMLHAFNDDYNRVGMCGATNPADLFVPAGLSDEEAARVRKELDKKYEDTRFPSWFREGLASAVENIYQFRHKVFQFLRYDRSSQSLTDTFSPNSLLISYLTVNFTDGTQIRKQTFDLEDAGKNEDSLNSAVDGTPAKYVTGYLACLYLGELSAMKLDKGYTTADETNHAMYLDGINSILERLHNGETLDGVIRDISGGRYQDTDDFEKQFIKGKSTGTGDSEVWHGDQDSLRFCSSFLNYMQQIDQNPSFKNWANGSILQPFNQDYETPLDRTAEAASELYKIIEKNSLTESTVLNENSMKDGGKSRSGSEGQAAENTSGSTVSAQANTAEIPEQLAAKEPAGPVVPADPEEPAEPAVSAEAAESAEPVVSAEFDVPAEPAGPAVPAGAAETAEPAVSAEAAETAEPAVPAEAAGSAEPVVSAEVAETVEPACIAESAEIAGPAGLTEPAESADPADPLQGAAIE